MNQSDCSAHGSSPVLFADKSWRIKVALQHKVPIAVAGRINDPYLAEALLKEGKTDLVAMGRPLLADPEFPRKAQEGRVEDIRKCIGCNQGCMDRMLAQQDITCLSNPLCGYEREREIKEAAVKKKVMVIGGGPAGMETARVAALRGLVVLYNQGLGRADETGRCAPGRKWKTGELSDRPVEEAVCKNNCQASSGFLNCGSCPRCGSIGYGRRFYRSHQA